MRVNRDKSKPHYHDCKMSYIYMYKADVYLIWYLYIGLCEANS